VPSIAVAVGAVVLVAALPMRALVTTPPSASRYEAFTLVPFAELAERADSANLRLLAIDAALALLALAALVPARRRWLVPASLLAVFAVLSAFATWTTVSYARSVRTQLVGPEKQWVDRAASGPVAFLTGGEASWSAVYENVFWNREIDRVYTLPGFAVPGPLPQTPVGPQRDGDVVLADGRAADARFVVASHTLTLFGRKLASPRSAKLALWRIEQPLRLSTWLTGLGILRTSSNAAGNLHVEGSIDSDARIVVYACSGVFKLALVSTGGEATTAVEVLLNGVVVRHGSIPAWFGWHATIPARARPDCELEIRTSSRLDVKWLELKR
jgi:hypothetical protein